MRQTLFRFRLDELWSLRPITVKTEYGSEEVAAVGAGALLLLWVAYGLFGLYRDRRAGELDGKRLGSAAGTWLAVAALIVSLPYWAPRFLPEGVPVFGYGMMVFLGFAFGLWAALRRARSVGIDPNHVWDLVTWFFVAGIGGARLFYVVQKRDLVFANVSGPGDFLFRLVNLSDGGLVLLGGVTAVVAATLVFCRRRRLSPLRMGDLLVPSFFVGLGFGRIGCLLNGCCFGDRCELPWAIHFPARSVPWGTLVDRGYLGPDAAMTYGLHPTQVYSAITAFLLAGLTAAYFRRRPFDGSVVVLGMLLYAAKRIVVEFLRGDELGQFGTMFTISQWISAGIFVGGLVLLVVLTARHRPRLATAGGGPSAGG